MLIPAFQVHLNNTILKGLVTVGKYDGKYPCLTAATNAGKVFIHCPHERDEATGKHSMRFLNINRKITALTSGMLDPELKRDVVLIGTPTNLLAYDIEHNSDIFFKDVPDGINAMIFGRVPGIDAPLAIVGGNCSIQGFDATGSELFWTVTGDNVSALAFCDADGDGENELLVGSEDYEIRIFQQEEVVSETTETDRVVSLVPLYLTVYGYALGNGTIGVYDRSSRLWRVKSKNEVCALGAFDLDSDGVPELVSGWSNGRLDVRNDRNGELVYRDHFNSPISALMQEDYRLDGRRQIICCASSGEVRGYLPADQESQSGLMDAPGGEDKAVHELMSRKQELEMELKALETNLKRLKSGDQVGMAMIPPDSRVSLTTNRNRKKGCLELVVSTNNDTVIRAVAVFALDGGVFEGESLMSYPKKGDKELTIAIKPEKNNPCELKLQVLVAARSSSLQFMVFEKAYRLSKFAMYMPCTKRSVEPPTSHVTFCVNERVERIAMWIAQAFNMVDLVARGERLDLGFISLRDGTPLWIVRTRENGGKVSIRCDNMATAAEVMQDLCRFLNIKELESVAEFPEEMKKFQDVLLQVDEFNSIRLKLTAEMADNSNLVKNLVIKAEDARILGDMKLMRRMYTELFTLNNELIREYQKRSTNHQNLLNALKDVNQMIQKAARLRVGEAKTKVVTACRNAIKSNNIQSLFQIIRQGGAAAAPKAR